MEKQPVVNSDVVKYNGDKNPITSTGKKKKKFAKQLRTLKDTIRWTLYSIKKIKLKK